METNIYNRAAEQMELHWKQTYNRATEQMELHWKQSYNRAAEQMELHMKQTYIIMMQNKWNYIAHYGRLVAQ